MEKVCISGFGDIGQRVARHLRQQTHASDHGLDIYGLTRRTELRDRLQAMGIIPVIADLDDPASLNTLPTRDSIMFHLAPPPATGQQDTRFRNLLQACEHDGMPAKIILLSTTAVYGDCQGQWVDETAPVKPQTDRGKRRLDAETALHQWAAPHNVNYAILRVSGIYGAGRLPLERLRQGLPILREDQAPFSNRIHQDDLAMVCVAAAQRAPNGAIYNVCDGQPSTMSHYFKLVAQAAGLPLPPEVDREQAQQVLSAGMLSYLSESRRLRNDKMLRELEVTLQYPDLAAGLGAMDWSSAG
ncbi:MAG: SDR family oxidoreductase [Gammaproteobacteria bacterium]|jgi:nucleoside-diphosphate-sugar epimerase